MRLTEYDDIGELFAVAFVVIFGMVVWATVAEQRLTEFTRDPAAARAQALSRRTATRATLRSLIAQLRPTRRLIKDPWGISAIALSVLTVAVVGGSTVRFDGATLPWFTALDTRGVGHITARVLVMGGQFWLVGSIAITTAVWRGVRQRDPRPVVVTGAAMVAMSMSLWLMKVLVGRTAPRAGENTVLDGGHSYPSGHAATAVVCLTLTVALLWGGRASMRRWVLPLAVAASGVVGVCTVVLGYHWVSDVVGGWAAGALVALPAVRWLDEPANNRQGTTAPEATQNAG
ncbi:phosphatase PAP2 family protein [Pedococcus sp. NPDC057267]|uniref:phosphatase PAP2 family protein n=1 Tax=Pedococcus sp. NPDC057267 TaxID=3346077 RepID=UPI00363B76E7